MEWDLLRHIVVIGYGLMMAIAYAVREPYFVYPTMALSLAAVWEGIGWAYPQSLLSAAAVAFALVIAAATRIVQGKPLLVRDPADARVSLTIAIGGFAAAFLMAILVAFAT